MKRRGVEYRMLQKWGVNFFFNKEREGNRLFRNILGKEGIECGVWRMYRLLQKWMMKFRRDRNVYRKMIMKFGYKMRKSFHANIYKNWKNCRYLLPFFWMTSRRFS